MFKFSSKYQISTLSALLFLVLGIMLVISNIILVRQNRAMGLLVERSSRVIEAQIGTQVSPLYGLDINANKLLLNYGEDPRKTLIFVFSPTCGVCDENMPNWDAIIKSINPEHFRLVAIALQPKNTELTKEYVRRHPLGTLPIIVEPDPKNIVDYKLMLTPQMILVSADGKVEKVWTGLLRDKEKKEITTDVGAQFPTA